MLQFCQLQLLLFPQDCSSIKPICILHNVLMTNEAPQTNTSHSGHNQDNVFMRPIGLGRAARSSVLVLFNRCKRRGRGARTSWSEKKQWSGPRELVQSANICAFAAALCSVPSTLGARDCFDFTALQGTMARTRTFLSGLTLKRLT